VLFLPAVRHDAGLLKLHQAVAVELGLDAEVLVVGPGDRPDHGIGNLADADLEGHPVPDEVPGDELPDPLLLRREVFEVGGGKVVDGLHPVVVHEEVDRPLGYDTLPLGERHAEVHLADDALGGVDRRMESLDRQAQAVFARHLMGPDLEQGDVGLVFPALADEALDVGQRAGQIIRPALVGRLADFARGEDRIGQDPVLQPLLDVGHRALEKDVDHPDERQLG
jgi:hypothetical protein